MKLLIFYLTDDRRHHTFPHFVNMINKSNKKDLFQLLVLTHTDDSYFYKENLGNTDIKFGICKVAPDKNYLQKIFSTKIGLRIFIARLNHG